MSENQNKIKIISDFITQIWDHGDLTGIETLIGHTYTIHCDPGDPWDGQELSAEEFCNRVEKSRAPFPDQKFHIKKALASHESVTMCWDWSAHHLGDIPNFPATGNEIKMRGMTVYFLEDSRLTGHWQSTDRLAVFQQLAAAKAT